MSIASREMHIHDMKVQARMAEKIFAKDVREVLLPLVHHPNERL
jgi:hypothetical protein